MSSGKPERKIGRFEATREGFGFIVREEGERIYVAPGETGGALHGDRVEFEILRPAEGEWSPEGAVRRIVERGFRTLTGVVAGTRKRPFLIPDHPRLPSRMRLVGNLRSAEPGQRVLCRLHDVGGRTRVAALLERVLGDADDARLDEEIVIAEYGLPGDFPREAVAEAERAQATTAHLGPGAGEARADFSGEAVLTIDPADARDFDDAVSLESDPEGGELLRVHIADVSASVPVGGFLDREARLRGNSIYLPGRMIPMFPELLATDLMSLSPGQPRRVLTVSARLGREGEIRGTRIDAGWIVSRHRLDYATVQDVLDGNGSVSPQVDAGLRRMDALAQRLRARRFQRGGFDLMIPEIRLTLDADGYPGTITRRRPERSHQIIEEFMILANRIACSYARRWRQPYLYRIHKPPDPLAIETFCGEVRTLAPEVHPTELQDLAAIRRWLSSLPREPRTGRIHALFLQAMQRAVYANVDRGHFGLGLRGYGHFTSPIRRYPDLFNHRVIRWGLAHGRRPLPAAWRDDAAGLALHCSGTEERAERSERTLIRIKLLRWAERHLGDCYRGTILGVLPAGYFVELDDLPVEGFIPRGEAEAVAAPEGWRRRAGPGRGGLQIDDPVIVQIARVDRRERRLDFYLRAAGQRALDSDPERLEPLVDATAQIRSSRQRRRRRRRR